MWVLGIQSWRCIVLLEINRNKPLVDNKEASEVLGAQHLLETLQIERESFAYVEYLAHLGSDHLLHHNKPCPWRLSLKEVAT